MNIPNIAAVLAVALGLSMGACTAVSPPPGSVADLATDHPDALQRLVKSKRESSTVLGRIHIEIDLAVLRAVQTHPEWRKRLLDPVTAAMALAPAIGIPAGGDFVLVGQVDQNRSEAGYALATVLATLSDGRQFEVRMIAEPHGASAEPIWVPNDVTGWLR